MLKLYENIKRRRLELGLTQTQIASKLGYADKSMIAKIEKGQIDLPQSKIMAFAQVLKMDPGLLMGWDDSSSSELVIPQVSDDEQVFLDMYRALDPDDRAEVRGFIKGLLAGDKYKDVSTESKAI